MPRLLNNSTKLIENVPDDAVVGAIASGDYSPRRGTRLPVVNQNGDIGTIDSGEAQAAFRNNNFIYHTREQENKLTDDKIREAWRQEFDQPGSAFGAGALRGVTFGLSDVAMRGIGKAIGKEDQIVSGLRTLKEVNPFASTAGEIGGIAASLLVPGSVAAWGTMGAAKAGAAITEATLGKIIAKYGQNSIMTKAAQAASGTAIEGALFGAGEVVSQAALDDPKLSAQHALATVGMGAVIGGAFGGLTKLGGESFNKFKAALQESTLPSAAADVIGKASAWAISHARGMNPDDTAHLKKLFATTEGRQLVWEGLKDRVVHVNTMKGALSEINKIGDSILSVGGAVREAERSAVNQKKAGQMRFIINKQLNTTIDNAIETITKKSQFYKADAIPALEQVKQNLATDLAAAETRTDIHKIVENYKLDIRSKMKFSAVEKSGETAATGKVYRDVVKEFDNVLTSDKYFGKLGQRYANINAAMNKFYTAQGKFQKNFTSKQTNEKNIEELLVDTKKVDTYFRNPENVAGSDKDLLIKSYLDAIENLNNVAKDHAGGAVLSDFIVQEANKAKEIIKKVQDTRVSMVFLNNAETMTGKSLIGTGLGALAGNLVGGAGGALLGGMFGTFGATPKSALRLLFAIENHGIAGQQRLAGAVNKFYDNKLVKIGSSAYKAIVPIVKPVTIESAIKYLGGTGATIDDLKTTLDNNVADPQKLWGAYENNNPDLDEISPNYSMEMINTMAKGVHFLATKMPRNYTQDMFGNKKSSITDYQKRTIEAYTDAVFRPSKIYEELEKERPDPRVIEAVQAVYPAIFSELQKEVMKQALDKDIPYQKKLILGKIFALPTTTSLEKIGVLQKTYIKAPPAPQKAPTSKSVALAANQTSGDKIQD